MTLIYLGLIKFFTESLKANHSGGYIFSLILVILGITIFYRLSEGKRTLFSDLSTLGSFLVGLLTDSKVRKMLMQTLSKNWYNQKVALNWQLKNFTKILRRFRVRFSHKESKNY